MEVGGINMDLNSYISSLKNSERMINLILSESINEFEENHKVKFLTDEDSLFYAKGFYDEKITDKLFFFGEKFIKIVHLNRNDAGYINEYVIVNKRVDDITDITISFRKDFELELVINLSDGEIVLNSKKDSNGLAISKSNEQIKKIYALLTE